MTNTTQTPSDAIAHFGDDDPRALFARAVHIGGEVIGAIGPDQLDGPTPCPDFDVRSLLGHLVEVLHGVAAIGRGQDPFSVGSAEVADDGWSQAWLDAAHEVQAAWTDDAAMTRTVVLPWQTASGSETLCGYMCELTVHTWDVATATGQRPAWDDEVIETALAAIATSLPAEDREAIYEAARKQLPEEYRDGPPPFLNAVDVPADAAPIDKLVAWTGRNPA